MIRVGDVVRLNSGGPKMAVARVHDTTATCSWFSRKGKAQSGVFAPECLVLAEQYDSKFSKTDEDE